MIRMNVRKPFFDSLISETQQHRSRGFGPIAPALPPQAITQAAEARPPGTVAWTYPIAYPSRRTIQLFHFSCGSDEPLT